MAVTVDDFFDLAEQVRKDVTQSRNTSTPMAPAEAARKLADSVDQTLGEKVESEELVVLFEMSNPTFTYIREKTTSLAELIMADRQLPFFAPFVFKVLRSYEDRIVHDARA